MFVCLFGIPIIDMVWTLHAPLNRNDNFFHKWIAYFVTNTSFICFNCYSLLIWDPWEWWSVTIDEYDMEIYDITWYYMIVYIEKKTYVIGKLQFLNITVQLLFLFFICFNFLIKSVYEKSDIQLSRTILKIIFKYLAWS